MRKFFEGTSSHIFSGIKVILPLIVIYSILLLLGSLYWSFFTVLAEFTFDILIILLTMIIAYKIGGKTTLLTGFIIGIRVAISSLGFFGAIFMALFIGFLSKLLIVALRRNRYKIQYSMVVTYLIIPAIILGLSYLSLSLFVYPLILGFLDILNTLLGNLSGGNLIFLAGALGFMTAFDLGGPVNKVAYTFALSAFLEGHYEISAPLLIASTIPPLGIVISAYLLPKRFTEEEKKARPQTVLFSAFGLTEGALAYVASNPLAVMISVVTGSTIAAMMCVYFELSNSLLASSLLGLFGTSNILLYLLTHAIGVGVVIVGIFVLKKKV